MYNYIFNKIPFHLYNILVISFILILEMLFVQNSDGKIFLLFKHTKNYLVNNNAKKTISK